MLSVQEFDNETKNVLTQISASFPQESLVRGLVMQTFDKERMTGIGLMADPNKAVNQDVIRGDSFQYLGAVQIDMDVNRHIDPAKADAYFAGKRSELDAAVPQFGANAPPSLQYRDRQTSNDRVVTDVELGQYGGRVGVYKQTSLHDPDEPTKYWLVAVGGAQKACEDLRKFVSEKMNGIENWDSAYLNKQFQNSDELGKAFFL